MENIRIDSPLLKKFTKAYQYALDKTQQELGQSVEGMYHNLNTLDNGALA